VMIVSAVVPTFILWLKKGNNMCKCTMHVLSMQTFLSFPLSVRFQDINTSWQDS
jgi:hypothetical protein